MAKIMEMPKLSDTMKEGAVAQWLLKEGDKVTAGSPIIEIETDKATMEYEAPAGGILLKILVGAGQTCALQAPIAVIGKSGEDWQAALSDYEKSKSNKTPAQAPATGATSSSQGSAALLPAVVDTKVPGSNSSSLESSRMKASPLAKKIAKEQGVNLAAIHGSGPGGRIVARDLSASVSAAGPIYAAVATSMPAEVVKIPLSMMRKTIASRLAESVQTAPHFFLTIRVNMDGLLNWRKGLLAKLGADQKFSINDVIVLLTAKALKKHPEVNSSWQGDHIAQYRDVHVGIAVALPTGLITPVIRNADTLSIIEIARQARDFATRAKLGQLKTEDYQGGTFTISNLGMAGIENFTAIINPPQAAILAVGASMPTPVVTPKGEIAIETQMKVTLSCDHRVIDGAVGSEFLKTWKTFIEDPYSALML